MKISVALSIVILVVGIALGFAHRNQVSVLRQDRNQLVAKAQKLGISVSQSNADGETRITKRQREDRDKQTRSISAELIAFAKDKEQQDLAGGDSDQVLGKRGLELMERLMALEPDQLRAIIAQLKNAPGLSEEGRKSTIAFSIMMLSREHPAAALGLFTETGDLLDKSDINQYVFASSLTRWAKENPRAALDWMKENSAKHPELADDDTKCGVLAGAAQGDPKLAFKLLGELGMGDSTSAVQAIVEAAKTPEQRAATLTAFRQHLATIQDESERDALREEALGGLARTISGEDFESVTKWVASQKLSADENEQFVEGLSYDTTKAETGRWIEWMAKTLPPEKLDEQVADLVSQWTQQDYLAAGKWLSSEASGPAKNASIKAYAETVAEYEPKIAEQWAMTLPAGGERDDTLKSIYENWPKSDKAGAAAFAAEHSISADPTEEP